MQKLKATVQGQHPAEIRGALLRWVHPGFTGGQQLQISEKREELQNLQDQLNTQTIRNEEIQEFPGEQRRLGGICRAQGPQ